jgi:anti-anti-sigma regulatory factor
MLNVTVAKIGELTVVGCAGRIVQRESVSRLREAVTSQIDARIVVLELSEVPSIGGGGLGMLASLQRWAREHNIRFLLFHPSKSVQSKLKRARSNCRVLHRFARRNEGSSGLCEQSIFASGLIR